MATRPCGLVNTGPERRGPGDRAWGLRPHTRTTCPADTWVFLQERKDVSQVGGGACGRRPHARSPGGGRFGQGVDETPVNLKFRAGK